MKVNDSNLSSLASSGAAKAKEPERTGPGSRTGNTAEKGAVAQDDVHLSELVRSLRSLASDSPERQARLEQIARAYASGSYEVDSEATAAKIIDDAFQH